MCLRYKSSVLLKQTFPLLKSRFALRKKKIVYTSHRAKRVITSPQLITLSITTSHHSRHVASPPRPRPPMNHHSLPSVGDADSPPSHPQHCLPTHLHASVVLGVSSPSLLGGGSCDAPLPRLFFFFFFLNLSFFSSSDEKFRLVQVCLFDRSPPRLAPLARSYVIAHRTSWKRLIILA